MSDETLRWWSKSLLVELQRREPRTSEAGAETNPACFLVNVRVRGDRPVPPTRRTLVSKREDLMTKGTAYRIADAFQQHSGYPAWSVSGGCGRGHAEITLFPRNLRDLDRGWKEIREEAPVLMKVLMRAFGDTGDPRIQFVPEG